MLAAKLAAKANSANPAYVDGVQVSSAVDNGLSLTVAAPKVCGHASDTNQWMTGRFDTIRFWNRALSAAEIAAAAAGNGTCEAH